jgi:hypothetical protein
MQKIVTVKEKFDVLGFDPLGIDISEFEELAEEYPKDANIDLAIAESLAQKYLRAADRCSEILSTLIWYEGNVKAQKNAIKNRLFLVAKDEGYKTVEERKAYAESHDSYLEIDIKSVSAFAVRKNFEMKLEFFLKSHQFMKDKLKAEVKHQQASGFSETAGQRDNTFGERDW